MYLFIASDGVDLKQPEVVTDLYASYRERLTPDRLAALLSDHAGGTLLEDGAHIMIPVATLRRLAQGRVPDGWDADFEAMLDQARARGFVTEEGDEVRAHLERER